MNKIVLVLVLLGVAGFAASFKIDDNSGASLGGDAGSKRDSQKSFENENNFRKSLKFGIPGDGSHDAGLKGGRDKSARKNLQFGKFGAGSRDAGSQGGSEKSSEKSLQIGTDGADSRGAGLQGSIEKSFNLQIVTPSAGSHGAGLKGDNDQSSEQSLPFGIPGAGSGGAGSQGSEQSSKIGSSGGGFYSAGFQIFRNKASESGITGGEQSQNDAEEKAEAFKNAENSGAHKLEISVQRSIKGGWGGPPTQIEN